MCNKEVQIWRCGHNCESPAPEPCETAKDRGKLCETVTYDLVHLDFHCSPNCCNENMGRLSQEIIELTIAPKRETAVERKTRNALKQRKMMWLSVDLDRHVVDCLKAFKERKALTNEKRLMMGWAPNPPVFFDMPDKRTHWNLNAVQHEKELAEFQESEFMRQEIQRYREAKLDEEAPMGTAPKLMTPEDVQVGASWNMDEQTQKALVEGMRGFNFSNVKQDGDKTPTGGPESAGVATSAEDPEVIGFGERAVGPNPMPARWFLSADENNKPFILDETEEDEFIGLLKELNENSDAPHAYGEKLQSLKQTLMELSTHLAFYQPLGDHPRFFAVACVVRMDNLRTLVEEIEIVRERLPSLRRDQLIGEDIGKYVGHVRDWARWRWNQLDKWWKNASEEMSNMIDLLREEPALLDAEFTELTRLRHPSLPGSEADVAEIPTPGWEINIEGAGSQFSTRDTPYSTGDRPGYTLLDACSTPGSSNPQRGRSMSRPIASPLFSAPSVPHGDGRATRESSVVRAPPRLRGPKAWNASNAPSLLNPGGEPRGELSLPSQDSEHRAVQQRLEAVTARLIQDARGSVRPSRPPRPEERAAEEAKKEGGEKPR